MSALKGSKKSGGRKAGTPNRPLLPIEQIMKDHNCNPLNALIECMQMPEHKFNAAKELMQYIYPKKKSLEVDASINMELARSAEEYSKLDKNEQIRMMEEEIKRLKG